MRIIYHHLCLLNTQSPPWHHLWVILTSHGKLVLRNFPRDHDYDYDYNDYAGF